MNFFVLQNPKAGHGDAVTDYLPVGERTGEAPRCPVCGNFLGMLPLLLPVRVELNAWGSRWGDVAFGPGDELLVTTRLKKAFVDAGLSGFVRFDLVEIVKARKRGRGLGDPPEYQFASIQRSRAAVDDAASGVVRNEATTVCEECRLGGILTRVRRLVLEPNTWSGEDVFFLRGLPGIVVVSERLKRLCEENGFANCLLVPIQDFGFDHDPARGAGSGRN
jgi:hypothetical protein